MVPNWYRKWSDGFIEQGGYVSAKSTVTFPTAFSTTNYTAIASGKDDDWWQDFGMSTYSYTTTSMLVYINKVRFGAYWMAYGY